MAKDTFYFSHDYNSRGDRKMVNLLMKAGVAGIGIYWCIVEMLYEEGGYLMLSECERIAFELRTDSELVQSVIDSSLFEKDSEKFWSESVLRRIDKRKEKSAKTRESALSRWNNANALRTNSESNAIKGKESKGKKSDRGNTPTSSTSPTAEEAQPPIPPTQTVQTPTSTIATVTEVGSEKVQEVARMVWQDQIWRENTCMGQTLTMEQLQKWMGRFNASVCNDPVPDFDARKYKKMFPAWVSARKSKGDSVDVPTGPVKTSNAAPLKRATA